MARDRHGEKAKEREIERPRVIQRLGRNKNTYYTPVSSIDILSPR